jgi:type I restriction enzyme S subunit
MHETLNPSTPEVTRISLGDAVSVLIDHRGRTPKKLGGDFSVTGVPVISAKCIRDGRVTDQDRRFVSQEMFAKWMPESLQAGDVLVTSEAPLGEVARWSDDGPVCLGQRLFALRADPAVVDQRFLYYLMRSREAQAQVHSRATGTTAQGIRQSQLVRVVLTLPPMEVQRDASGVLGALDDKIDVNRRMGETLEEIVRALFASWFVDFDPVRGTATVPEDIRRLFPDRLVDSPIGPVPEGWDVGRISDIAATQYGYTASSKNERVGPHLLRVKDINKKAWVEWELVPFCEIEPELFGRYALHRYDIVVARMADPGKAAIIDEDVDAVFASYLVRLATTSTENSLYLYYLLTSDVYVRYVSGVTQGSVQKSMNAKVIVAAPCALAPTSILRAFASIVGPIREQLAALTRESNLLAELRDTLLPKLISGEVRLNRA